MRRWAVVLPVAGGCALAAYLGLGLAKPLTETEIIDHFAKTYLIEAPDGARATDCHALPGDVAGVRLVVVCAHADGMIYTYPAGPRGALVELDQGPQA